MSPSRLKRSRSIGDLYSKREAFGLDMTGDFAAAWLPAIFVPMTGIVFPAVFIVLVGRVITAAECPQAADRPKPSAFVFNDCHSCL